MEEVHEILLNLAVCAVLGVLMACSMVPGRPLWVPGLTNPLTGRPACDIGLKIWDCQTIDTTHTINYILDVNNNREKINPQP